MLLFSFVFTRILILHSSGVHIVRHRAKIEMNLKVHHSGEGGEAGLFCARVVKVTGAGLSEQLAL